MYKKEPLEINYIVIVREVIYNTYIVKVRELFQVSRRLVSFENLYNILLQNVGMFRIKIDKTCIKTLQLQQQNRWDSHSN